MKLNDRAADAFGCATAMTVEIAASLSMRLVDPVRATAQYATQTGKTRGNCQTSAAGGGPLTPLGEKFKASGDKLPEGS